MALPPGPVTGAEAAPIVNKGVSPAGSDAGVPKGDAGIVEFGCPKAKGVADAVDA